MPSRAKSWWRSPLLLMLVTVVAGDLLFHDARGLGMNSAAMLALLAWMLSRRFARLRGPGGFATLFVALAIAVSLALEPTALGLLLGAAVLLALVVIGRGGVPKDAVEALAVALSLRFPLGSDMSALARWRRSRRRPVRVAPAGGRAMRWVPGLALASGFSLLFLAAGPVYGAQWRQLTNWIDLPPLRILQWIGWAAGAWILMRARPRASFRAWARRRMRAFELTPPWSASLSRALLLCNMVFVIQSAGDVGHVFVRAPLPLGMTLSSQAQTGAHVLLVATLLSAAIVLLAAARGGPWHDNPTARGFVESWLVQDAILVAGAFARLHLYVSAYGLTRLRAAAFAWVVLVAIGLLLVLLRLVLRREGRWLVTSCAAATACLLVAASLVNVDARIARFNVDHCREAGGEGTALDVDYFARLGPETMPALLTHSRRVATREAAAPALHAIQVLSNELRASLGDWRRESLRRLALRRWLEEHPTATTGWHPTP